MPGWKKSSRYKNNLLNPCSEPICSNGCLHGECKAPNYCACEIGWEGQNCSICLKSPGCKHGYCEKAFQCICDSGWSGSQCEIRK